MRFQMLWVRGIVFTVLVPAVVGFFLPSAIDPRARLRGGISDAGWLLAAAGMLTYALCLIRFLAAGGTPAIYFARPLRLLIGEEPAGLVSGGPYRFSRNPLSVSLLLLYLGLAFQINSSWPLILFLPLLIVNHYGVVLREERYLEAKFGDTYRNYRAAVRRWI